MVGANHIISSTMCYDLLQVHKYRAFSLLMGERYDMRALERRYSRSAATREGEEGEEEEEAHHKLITGLRGVN